MAQILYYALAVYFVFGGLYFISGLRSYRRLKHFKGPALAAWSDLWYIRAVLTGKQNVCISDVNAEYGKLARIGPNTLITSDEDFYRKMHQPRSGYYRADWYKAFRFGADVDNVFSVIDNDQHAYLRKRLINGYSGKDIPEIEANMDTVIFTMIKSWRERYVSHGGNTKPMDLARQMQYLTLDIITSLSFSEPFGWVSTDSDLYEYVETMAKNFPIMYLTSAIPGINDILRMDWVQRLLSPSIKDKVGMGKIKAISSKIVTQRFADYNSNEKHNIQKDMTTSFISHGLTQAEITDNALLTILAGSDTSATTVRSGLMYIVTQPRIMNALQAECDEANVPNNQIITYDRALQLPYLQACIKEALRLVPPGSGLNPRITPPQGDWYEGKFIPGGTIIAQCAWSLQRRNYEAYGMDADIFRPERWIEAAAQAQAGNSIRLERMEKAHELVFSIGDFKCLGYKIALMEISKIMFEVVRRFDLGLVDGMKAMDVNLNYGLFIQDGMWVRVQER